MRANRRRPNARAALHEVRKPLPISELMRITDIWVETALRLGDRSIRTMERLVRAQSRRAGVEPAVREVS
jgi:DSF synthase